MADDTPPVIPDVGTPISPLYMNAATAEAILRDIGDRFVRLSESSSPQAWRQLRDDIMRNIHVLSPAVIPFKDLISTVAMCEEHAKGSSGKAGKSAEEALSDFLTSATVTGKVLDIPKDFGVDSSPANVPTGVPAAPSASESAEEVANGQ